MKQLLSADFYKLRKSKSPFVCAIVTLGLAVLYIVSLNLISKMSIVQDGVQVEGTFTGDLSFVTMFQQGFTSDSLLFIAIVISIFIGSEFAHGTIKNIASKSFSRTKLFLSKWIVSIATSIVYLLLYAVVFSVLAIILWGFGNPGAGFWSDFLLLTGCRILLNAAVCSIFVTLTMIIRQSGGAIAINICLTQFTALVVRLIQMGLNYLFKTEWNITQYLPTSIISELSTNPIEGGILLKGVIVSIVFIALSLAIGILCFRKTDIK